MFFHSKKILKKILVLGAALTANQLFAQTITYDIDHAVVSGTGCRKDVDAFLNASGNDLHLYATGIGVNLTGGESRLMDTKSCLIRIGVQIPVGTYIKSMKQKLTLEVLKTSGTTISASVRSTVGAQQVPTQSVTFGQGSSVNNPYFQSNRQETFLPNSPGYNAMCSPNRSTWVNLIHDVSIRAMKNSARETAIAALVTEGNEGLLEIELGYCGI